MRSRSPNLLEDERGTAFMEAIIIALFFVFVFAAIMHMHGVFDAKLKTYAEVRGCSWAYASNGCEGGLPSYCGGVTTTNELNPSGVEARTEQFKSEVDKVGGFASQLMGDIGLTGKRTTLEKKSAAVPRAPMLGGGSSTLRGKYAVLCNEPKNEAQTMAEQAFCRIGSGIPGCP